MSFAGFNNAISGMRLSERGLSVAGHNISNIATPGFSKQQLIAKETIYTNLYGIGRVGVGVDVDQLRQIRDNFLDINYRKENGSLGYWNVKSSNIQEVQTILSDPFGEELASAMNGFWNGWQELVKEPESLNVRALLRQKASVMVNSFNNIGNQLTKMQEDINKQIVHQVDEINRLAAEIANLNFKIKSDEVAGDNANDYRDKRNLLLDQLSEIINIEVNETSGYVDVTIGGGRLVSGVSVNKLAVKENTLGSTYLSPIWMNTEVFVNVKSGALKGYLEIRGENVKGGGSDPSNGSPDGVINISNKQTIPNIKEKLNELLYTLVTNVNDIHQGGYGIGNPPSTGIEFFTAIDPMKPLEMGNIQVNPLLFNLELIAASSSISSGDATNAQSIANIKNTKLISLANNMLSLNEFYGSIITEFGYSAQEAERMAENQNNIVSSLDNKRDAVCGVNLDEEMSDIMKYQHAYQANVRVLNTIDAMLDKIINEMLR